MRVVSVIKRALSIHHAIESMYGTAKLTPIEVKAVLDKATNPIHEDVNELGVKSFSSSQLAANNPIEDRRAIGRLLNNDGYLFGVFDGHAGTACAQAVSERLFEYIAVNLLKPDVWDKIANDFANTSFVKWYRHRLEYQSWPAMIKLHKNSLHRYLIENASFQDYDLDEEQFAKRGLMNAFCRLDEDLSQEAAAVCEKPLDSEWTDALDIVQSGSCGCVAYIRNDDIWVANVGDTRALLGRMETDGAWSAVPLSTLHNSENKSEMSRLLNGHPASEAATLVREERLLGALVPLRAFGDVRFKWPKQQLKTLERALKVATGAFCPLVLPNYHTPPYLIASPEVVYYKRKPSDKFLVLATDGLFDIFKTDTDRNRAKSIGEPVDDLADQTIVDIVGNHSLGLQALKDFIVHQNDPRTLQTIYDSLLQRMKARQTPLADNNPATHLIRNSLGLEPDGTFSHQRLSRMLSYPDKVARTFRDDITIIVVHFAPMAGASPS